jgi:LysW-gamma-L-alpha-aminoadipyl-6-phosphate/LysW-L-glutamyl-5-phosphate reductase
MIRTSIVGGSGYVGGELLRLLRHHPQVTLGQVTSRSQAGRFVHSVHPNLRGWPLKFSALEALEPCDLLFLALPHGQAAMQLDELSRLAPRVIDCSADFRLREASDYARWYGEPHPAPQWLPRFVYGLPELHRDAIRSASHVSGVGCNATATILALLPFARAGLIERAVVEVKVGSSEAGNEPGLATHHAERVNVVRSFAPTGHRHQAEIVQALGPLDLHFSATAVELVRGVLCTAHVFTRRQLTEKEVWGLFRETYREEPFVRIVKEQRGIYRYPEPKILAGTNIVETGFECDQHSSRVVALCALDNLMKGAAGTAVQCMNLMFDWPETTGLEFPGLHPV